MRNNPFNYNLDFGSHIGAYTLVSRKMGNKVIALDPDPENQALLYNSLGKSDEIQVEILFSYYFLFGFNIIIFENLLKHCFSIRNILLQFVSGMFRL